MKLAKVTHIFDRILDIAAVLAAAMVVFTMFAICIAITMRYFMNQNLTWVIDVTAILLLYITFLGAAWLLRAEGHVRMDLVISLLNPRHQAVLNTFTSIISTIMFLVLTWYGAKLTWMFAQMGHYMPTELEPPTFLVTLVIPLGSFLLFIESIRRTRVHLRNRDSSATRGIRAID